jgi:hypothetical protein
LGHRENYDMSGNRPFSKAVMDVLSGPAVLFDRPGPYFLHVPTGDALGYLGAAVGYIGAATRQIGQEQPAKATQDRARRRPGRRNGA